MGRPVVFVPRHIHDHGMRLLAEHCEVVAGSGPDAKPWDEALPDAVGILVRTEPITAEHLRKAPALQVIARHGVGVDNIDVAAATRQGVIVANAPDSNTNAVAEHVFALLLAVCRKVVAADQIARSGAFPIRHELAGISLRGKRLGIIGIGRIGTRVAHIAAHGFGMRVSAHDPLLSHDEIRARGAEPAADLAQLLRNSDVVTVHVPLEPATVGLLGAEELALLPPHAVLIHTARGGVVDETALITSLHEARIAGAGIDVFSVEPPSAESDLFTAANVVASPHVAAQTDEAIELMATHAAQAIVAVLQGGTPESVVNPEVLAAR